MRKKILFCLSALSSLFLLSPNAHADCGEVTITEMNWASSQVVTEVSKFILENGYGCTVVKVPSSTVPSVTSVAETGKPDIVTELWYNSAPVYRQLEEEGKIITAADVLSDGGEEGWWIPAYLAESNPELTTIAGILANPQAVGGRFHNCPDGWGCRIANDNLKIAYGLEDSGLEVFNHGSGETLATSIASAYADKKPWFGYYWGPTAVLGKYPMVMVDVGPHVDEYHKCNQQTDCATPRKSAYPSAKVVTGVTTALADKQPDVLALMESVSFTNKVMNHLLAWKQDNNASAEETAVYFLTRYKNIWRQWLNSNAKAKLSALL